MRSEEEIREKLKKLQSDMHYTLNNEAIKVGINMLKWVLEEECQK